MSRAARMTWALTPIVFVGLWLWATLHTPLSIRERVLVHIEPIGEIERGNTVGQTFLAPYPGLYRIEVVLADYGRLNTGMVSFRLSTGPEAPTPLVIKSFPAEAIRKDVKYTFEFDPIPDSAGKRYYFELAAPDAVPGNAITAYLSPSAPYPEGTAYRTGQPIGGDLVFSAYFEMNTWERTRTLLNQLTAGKPSLWGDERLPIGLAALYLLSVIVLVRHIRGRLSGDA